MCTSVHLGEKGSTAELAIWILAGDPHAAIVILVVGKWQCSVVKDVTSLWC